MKRLFLLSTALLFLSLGGLAACSGDASSGVAAQLKVEDFGFTRLEEGTRLFTGKLYNPTDRDVRGAQILVTLLDADNRQVGTTSITVRDIAAHDTTTFRQPLDSDVDVSGARVRSITVL